MIPKQIFQFGGLKDGHRYVSDMYEAMGLNETPPSKSQYDENFLNEMFCLLD